MGSFMRSATVAIGVAVALSTLAFGTSVVPSSAAPKAASTFPPCVPVTDRRIIKDPPLWLPTPANGRTIVLHARQTGPSDFCYVVDGQTSYYEAPTIQVHAGETFRLVLKNELNVPKPQEMAGMAMATTPRPAPTAADGCDQMGTTPLPPDNGTGVLGAGPTPDPRLLEPTDAHVGDTNIHTHGWDVSPAVDNVFKSTTNSSSTIGGPRSCVYVFAVPASQSPGTYWYHAHMHGVSNTQVGGGLAGALIVLPRNAPAPPDTRILIVKNLTETIGATPVPVLLQAGAVPKKLLTATNATPAPAFTFPPSKPGTYWSGIPFDPKQTGPCGWGSAPSPAPKTPSIATMVNGIAIPAPGENRLPGVLTIAQAKRVRVINATANNYAYLVMRVGASGTEDLQVIARDGVDLDVTPGEALPLPFKQLLLGPGNRADLLIEPSTQARTLLTRYTCTGALGLTEPTLQIASIPPATGLAHTLAAPRALAPAKTRAAAFVAKFQPQVIRQRELTFTQYDNFKHFYVTDTTNRSAATFGERPFWLQASKTPNDPDHYMLPNITVTQGDTEIWTLVNATAEIHAFHIHQMTFKTLSTDDPELMAQFKDVMLDVVPLAPAKPTGVVFTVGKDTYPQLIPTRTKILINFGVVHPGTFVYHCHMLAHEDSGMMGIITVLPRRPATR